MEDNQDETVERDYEGQVFDTEISDLGSLIGTILDYYSYSHLEDGEEWKKGTSHENSPIPKDVDDLVGKAFKSQLKKFIKE